MEHTNSVPNSYLNNEEYNFLKMMKQNDAMYNKVKKMNKTQLSNNSKNPRQSEINEQILKMYTEIDIEYNKFKNKLSSQCFKHKLINIEKNNRVMNQSMLKSSYIPMKIVKYIKEKAKMVLEYNCDLDNGRTVKINFVIFENSNYEINNIKKKSASYFKNCVLKIYIWLSILSKYADAECGKNLECFIYLTPFKRKLPICRDTHNYRDNHEVYSDKNDNYKQDDVEDDDDNDDDDDSHDNDECVHNDKVFKPLHVNGGISDICQTNGQIVVYRKEEWFKVFMHETMHNYGMDFSTLDISSANKKLQTIFSIQTHIKIYESYCEIWARIMNVFFECYFDIHRHSLSVFKPLHTRKKIINKIYKQHSTSIKKQPHVVTATHYNNDKKDNKNMFLNMFYDFMQHESVFSLFQCVKILNFMGLDYNIISTCNSVNHITVKKFYKEETNVFAYYIIVAILISNFNNFIVWCIDNNTNLINFKKEQTNIDSFIRFISENYKNNDVLKTIVELEHKLANHASSDKILLNTMRMTVIGGG